MKLARIGHPGRERPVVITSETEAIDVSGQITDYDGRFFAEGGMSCLRELLQDPDELPVVDTPGERFGAPITKPSKIICVGLNYRDHAAETGQPVPSEPVLFTKAPNTLSGPSDDVIIPPGSMATDWEIELAVVIGSPAYQLQDSTSAEECIAGYAISNDVSEREHQLQREGQWVKGKSSPSFNPLGPWLVTRDEVHDPQALTLELDLNGRPQQRSTTSQMVFEIAELVHYISHFMALEPGDLINTGTPPGVGLAANPPRYLQPGDTLDLRIQNLGSQRQHCRHHDRA